MRWHPCPGILVSHPRAASQDMANGASRTSGRAAGGTIRMGTAFPLPSAMHMTAMPYQHPFRQSRPPRSQRQSEDGGR